MPPIKPMDRESEKNKGQKAWGGQASGRGAAGVQMREGRCTAMRERKRGKNVIKTGKREIEEERKTVVQQ